MTTGKQRAGHLETGKAGEAVAADYIERLGWLVLDRNWRPHGLKRRLELDIVAKSADTIVFVEVKARKARHGEEPDIPAMAAFTAAKRARLAKAAALYCSAKKLWDRPCRFDLICVNFGVSAGVNPGLENSHTLEHLQNVIDYGQALDRGHSAWQPW